MRLRQKKLIWDILENSKAALRYLSSLDFEAFCCDDKTQAAVERRMEIVGEALKRLREIDESSLSEQIPDYFRIIGLRNHLAHGYDNVDLAISGDWNIRLSMPRVVLRSAKHISIRQRRRNKAAICTAGSSRKVVAMMMCSGRKPCC